MFAPIARSYFRSFTLLSSPLHTKAPTDNEPNCSIKERMDTHVIHQFGGPQPGAAHGNEPEFAIVRTVQRHPNASVRKNLIHLHSQMAQQFSDMSDEALDWLPGGRGQHH